MNETDYRYDSDTYLDNFFEYEQGTAEPIVRGRMKANINFWKLIQAPDNIIDIIDSGYKLPLYSTPPPAEFNNNKSAINHSQFVEEAISDLLDKGLVSECARKPDIINPLSVSLHSSGKKRLILDLRYINHYIWKEKIKFEDSSLALQYFQKGFFMFNFDLKSGYHHIDIFDSHKKFLSFSWCMNGKVRYFSFQVLPFGLSSAPYIFTKCLKPLVKFWREKGIFMVLYLDDGWGIAPTFDDCSRISQQVKEDLLRAGLVPNSEKSVWEPTQSIVWLGLNWDTQFGVLKVIPRRISSIIKCIQEIIRGLPRCTARKLARFVGKVISLKAVVGNLVQLKTRFSSMMICEKCSHWDKQFQVTSSSLIIDELMFWLRNVERLNKKLLFEYSIPNVFFYTDASHSGCGAWSKELKFNYSWSTSEVSKSSTWRELKAITLAVEAFVPKLEGRCVKVFTDNQAVPSVITKGSMKPDLQSLSIGLHEFCSQKNIDLQVQWIARAFNQEADALSREVDGDDWGVTDAFFRYIDGIWGPHTVDRFADNMNTKIARFNSKYWCVSSEQVDAFSRSWKDENNWLVPPITLVVQVLKHVRSSQCMGTLIVPYWPSAPFWPILFSKHSCLSSIVINSMRFNNPQGVYVEGRNKRAIFGTPQFVSPVLCVRLDGKR